MGTPVYTKRNTISLVIDQKNGKPRVILVCNASVDAKIINRMSILTNMIQSIFVDICVTSTGLFYRLFEIYSLVII